METFGMERIDTFRSLQSLSELPIEVKTALAEKNCYFQIYGIDYVLEQNRLCYYCYNFFFYYLNEYLKSIIDAGSEGQKEEITKSLIEYLTHCWIYKRLEVADSLR